MTGRRCRGDRGNVALLVVIMVPALLIAAGLVLDGGRQLQARRAAQGAAAAAARAAVQLSDQELYARRLDAGLATGRAHAELGAAGTGGAVTVSGDAVTVTVTSSVDFLILPGGRSVTERATARPVRGVTAGGSP